MKEQRQRIWRKKTDPVPSKKEIEWATDTSNPMSAFYGLVGNEDAVKTLQLFARHALKEHDHWCGKRNIALLGPASTGKTTLAEAFSRSTELPFCEISPSSHKRPIDIFKEIESTLKNYQFFDEGLQKTIDLEMVPVGDGMYCPPSMHVFIDEVHGYQTNRDVTGFLLKALEGNRITQIKDVGEMNCVNIQWTIATTHRGDLFGPLDTRFTKLQLEMYSKREIAQIVKLRMPELPQEACDLASHYGSIIPREVLQFAELMSLQKEYSKDWKEAAEKTAEMLRIDEHGMHENLVNILQVVGQMGTISEKRLPQLVGMTQKEMEQYQYPFLIRSTPDRPSLMVMTHKGYQLTQAGGEELDKRAIKHKREYV